MEPRRETDSQPMYARFSRRIQGLMIDSIVLTIGIVIILLLVTSLEATGYSRTIGIAGALVLLLYEPVLVAWTGSTLGHVSRNLRVVDAQTGETIGFFRACARFVLKAVLGLFSFLTMATTLRHQALHDILTSSTVQIRDVALAEAHHYASERTELASPGMPSKLRRTFVILGYLLLAFLLLTALIGIMETAGIVSDACLSGRRCTAAEHSTQSATGISWLMMMAFIIIQGWRGKLLGARMRTPGP